MKTYAHLVGCDKVDGPLLLGGGVITPLVVDFAHAEAVNEEEGGFGLNWAWNESMFISPLRIIMTIN